VLVSDKVDAQCVEVLRQQGDIDVDEKTGLSPSELVAIIGEYDGLIVRSSTKVTAEVLEAAGRLRVVGRAGAGVDNIDVPTATRCGVVVMNTPGGNSVSTAEHSFAMLMSLARSIPQAAASTKSGLWERGRYTGVELAGKTLGVIGLGKVGREVAQRGAAFGMKVLGHDPFVSAQAASSYGAQESSLEELYAAADFISVHLPLTEQTRHSISDRELALCRDGVRLVNCARGGIVDEAALLRALQAGKVAGVALDVYETEPPTESPLLQEEAVICTPHLGASTREAQVTVAVQVAEQVAELLSTGVIRNAVNVPSVEPELYEAMRPHLDLAERLGRIQGQLAEGQLRRITVEYHGEVTEHPTSPLTAAVLKGIMETISDRVVNFVNAPVFAQQRGIAVDELRSSDNDDYASLITVVLHTAEGSRRLSGAVFHRRDFRLVRLDEYIFDAVPEGHMLFYINDDLPGVIGRIGTTMGSQNVNIAQMTVGRHQLGGRALTVLNVDSRIPDDLLEKVLSDPTVVWAKRISL